MLDSESAKRILRFDACLPSCGLYVFHELQIPPLYHRHLNLTSQIVLQLRYD